MIICYGSPKKHTLSPSFGSSHMDFLKLPMWIWKMATGSYQNGRSPALRDCMTLPKSLNLSELLTVSLCIKPDNLYISSSSESSGFSWSMIHTPVGALRAILIRPPWVSPELRGPAPDVSNGKMLTWQGT